MPTSQDTVQSSGLGLPRLYTVREVTTYLRIKKSKIYQLMHDGLLPFVQVGVGGRRRITETAILAFVNGVGSQT